MEATDANVIPYHKSNRGRTGQSATKPARKQAAGRKAFQGDYCEIHSGLNKDGTRFIRFDSDGNEMFGGEGCSKFSHLRTDGLGSFPVPYWRILLVTLTKTIKPLFIVSFAVGSLYLVLHFVGGALHFNNTVPRPTDSGVPNNVRHPPPNGVSHRGTVGPNSTPSGNPSIATSGQVK